MEDCQSDGFFNKASNNSLIRKNKFVSIDYLTPCTSFLSSRNQDHVFSLQLLERSYTIKNVLAHNIYLRRAFTSLEVKCYFLEKL